MSKPGTVNPTDLHVNEVRLIGRLAAAPIAHTLPSGDELVTFRLVVRRGAAAAHAARPARGRAVIDALECAAWSATTRRTANRWQPGDVVEVIGAMRRRFYRGATASTSRVEIEVMKARRIGRTRDADAGP